MRVIVHLLLIVPIALLAFASFLFALTFASVRESMPVRIRSAAAERARALVDYE
jgi:hypothetical protein